MSVKARGLAFIYLLFAHVNSVYVVQASKLVISELL